MGSLNCKRWVHALNTRFPLVALEHPEFYSALCFGARCKLCSWKKMIHFMNLFIRSCYNSLEVKRYSSWNNWWIMHLCFGHNDLINIVGKVHLKAMRSLEQLIIDTLGLKGKKVQLLQLFKKGRKIWGIKNTLNPSELFPWCHGKRLPVLV